ncbi:MAG: DUF5522 domain-containing protein [Verrucomicrobiota bacterium]
MSDRRDIWSLHAAACREGQACYHDPDSGFLVFTEIGLKERGRCCGSGCRHCPFSHESTPIEKRPNQIQQASWLTDLTPKDRPADILFWSGGKDSYLALRELERTQSENIVLLTTFDAQHRFVAHQEIPIAQIVRQASHLNLPLLGVPLHSGRDYLEAVEPALRKVGKPRRFVFGDLHLEHIRSWRESTFAPLATELQVSLSFPLWQVSYETLMGSLDSSGISCEVTAVTADARGAVRVGDLFDRSLIDRLPAEVDQFGENGEFHTLAKVWEVGLLSSRDSGDSI